MYAHLSNYCMHPYACVYLRIHVSMYVGYAYRVGLYIYMNVCRPADMLAYLSAPLKRTI